MNYHIAKVHSKATARVVHNIKKCDKNFHRLYNLPEHQRKSHGAHRGSGAPNVDNIQLMGYVDDNSLRVELERCNHFLMDSNMENRRRSNYNSAMDCLDPKYLLEKLDVVYEDLKCVAKLNIAFGFELKNKEDGSCRFFYAHEKITLVERSKLVATTEDLTKIKNLLSNTDLSASCTREKVNTK